MWFTDFLFPVDLMLPLVSIGHLQVITQESLLAAQVRFTSPNLWWFMLENNCAKLLKFWKFKILVVQKEDLRKIMELLFISEQHARTLLIHYRWDVERIFELLEWKGKERLFSEAGVTIIENKHVGLLSSSAMYTCNICFEDIHPDAVTEMDCGHCYCNDCKFLSLF